jgi:hypothetical protein
MKKLLKPIAYIESLYLFILPFMGYMGTGILNHKFGMLPLLGIGFLIIYQMFAYAFWVENSNNKKATQHLFLPVSIALTILNYVWLQENFWLFWTEKAVFEMSAICISFLIIIFFSKNYKNESMAKEMGIGIPIMLGLILVVSIYEIFFAWLYHMPYLKENNYWHLISVAVSFVLDILWIYPLMKKFQSKKIQMTDLSASKYGMIIICVELGLWIIVIPATFLILGIIG